MCTAVVRVCIAVVRVCTAVCEGMHSSCEGIHKMRIIPKLGECTTMSVTVIGRVYNSLECYNNWGKNFTIIHRS